MTESAISATHARTYARTHTHVRTQARAHKHAHTRMHTHKRTHARTLTCTHARMYARTHAHEHTHARTDARTYARTHAGDFLPLTQSEISAIDPTSRFRPRRPQILEVCGRIPTSATSSTRGLWANPVPSYAPNTTNGVYIVQAASSSLAAGPPLMGCCHFCPTVER